jgi:hypothetical protein
VGKAKPNLLVRWQPFYVLRLPSVCSDKKERLAIAGKFGEAGESDGVDVSFGAWMCSPSFC